MGMIIVDVESDGPAPGVDMFSMVCFGAVPLDKREESFYGAVKPISEKWDPKALAVSGITREQHERFDDPAEVMIRFEVWLKKMTNKPVFVSDNVAFDWQWINYYFWKFSGRNPFGFSGRRIGDLYSGLIKDCFQGSRWKVLRDTKHTHNPVDDARGNAEALAKFREMGLKME